MKNGDFDHVLWIGGSVCSGKTAAANDLASRYGLRRYSFDAAEPFHIYRSVPERQPKLIGFMAMTMNERWILRTPEAMAEHTLPAWSDERFPMVLEDLRRLPDTGAVIAEGAGLLPEKVAPLLVDKRAALWLVASPECIRQVRMVRGEGISQATSDPRLAFENLVARDTLIAGRIRLQADRLGLQVVQVDLEALPITPAIVERYFAAYLR